MRKAHTLALCCAFTCQPDEKRKIYLKYINTHTGKISENKHKVEARVQQLSQ